MANTQINPLGTVSTPADWVLPDAANVTIGAVFAQYDGSGAAGNYVPTLDIISDSGHTVLSVVHDSTITAGSDAEASWASFLKTAAAAPGPQGILPNAVGDLNVPFGIADSTVTKLNWGTAGQNFNTTAAFSFPHDGSVGVHIHGIVNAYYVATLEIEWESFAADRYIEVAFYNNTPTLQQPTYRFRTAATPEGDQMAVTGALFWNFGANSDVRVEANVFQASGVSRNITRGELKVMAGTTVV